MVVAHCEKITGKNKIALAAAVLIAAVLLILATVSSVFSFEEQAKALSSTDVTSLADGQGLKEGKNNLRLFTVDEQTVSASGVGEKSDATENITIDNNELRDLHISGVIAANKGESKSFFPNFWDNYSAKWSPDGRIKSEGSSIDNSSLLIESYPRNGNRSEDRPINISSRIRLSPSLVNAIKDPFLRVNANVYVVTQQLPGKIGCNGYISILWAPDGVANDPANPQREVAVNYQGGTYSLPVPISLDSIDDVDNAFLEIKLDRFMQSSILTGKSGDKSSGDYTVNGICILFKEIYVQISIEVNNGLYFRAPAANYGDIIVQGDYRDEKCRGDYVKSGDILIVKTNLRNNYQQLIMNYNPDTEEHTITLADDQIEVKNEFRDYYIKGPNPNRTSTIGWVYPEDYLERIIDEDFDITGQTAKFLVKDLDPGMITRLTLTPYLWEVNNDFPQGRSLGVVSSSPITVLGDATPPESPEISTEHDFYQNQILEGKWYSKGFSETPERGVYVDVELTPMSFNVGAPPHYGSRLKIYYTTDGTNPIDSETRRVLRQDIDPNTSNRVATLFFAMPGASKQDIFTLRLVTFDYAGNISMPTVYSNIKIDCTDYLVNVYFVKGNEIASTYANSPSVAALGVAQLGRYVSETSRDYSSARYECKREYKRGDLVYIRLTLKKNSKYRLFQFYNSGNRDFICNEIDYGDFSQGIYGDFVDKGNNTEVYLYAPYFDDSPFILDDLMLSDINNLNFYFFFKEHLPITLGATEAVYDGNPKGIEQPTTDISGIQIVTYYQQNPEDEFVSTDKFINAGHYYFKCEIVDSTYYGWVTGPFIIHKADPYITGLQVLDIIYESSMDSAVIRCQNTDPDWGDAYNFNYSSDRKVMGNFRITYPVPESMNYIRPSQGLKDITVTFTPTAEYYINYNEVSFQTTLYVEYSTNLEMVFVPETFEYTYKPDTKRYASVITYPGNQALIYEYKREGEPDSAYTTNEPVDAGVYEVRVRTDLNLCNYDNMITTEGMSLKFVIHRQPLLVEAAPAVAYYQNDFDPIGSAYLAVDQNKQYIPISDWRYEYKVDGVWQNQRPVNAGVYEAKVIIDSMDENGKITGNYMGETITTLTIKKGNADATNSFSIVYPQPIMEPSIYGHIAYGQKLSDIVLTQGSGYAATYLFRTINQQGVPVYEKRNVEGEFMVAERLPDYQNETMAEYVSAMKNRIMPVGRYTGMTALYMVFVPADLTNFDISYSRVNITVVKSSPQFDNLIINNLVYGDIAADIILPGYSKSADSRPVYTIDDIVEVDGVIVNPTVYGLPITGKLLYIDQENKILSAGSQKVSFRFLPDDEDNIREISILTLTVFVEKVVLLLEVSPHEYGGQDHIRRVYGNQFVNPEVRVATPISDNVELRYTYTDAEGQEVTMNSSSPSGEYRMRVQIAHNNYQGEIEERLVIEKATPVLHTAPQAGTVRYGMDMSDVVLTNGRMQHPHTYYTIPGVFQFHGQPAPPAQVGEVPYEAVFVPSDTDNYNLVYFTVRIRVLKAFATITLSNLEHTYSGEACRPSYATNIVKRTEGGNEYYVNLDLPENEFTEFDRYLVVNFTFDGVSGFPVNAGRYALTARIDDECYDGTVEAEFVIRQAEAYIEVLQNSRIQEYNGGIIHLDAVAKDAQGKPLSVLISQTFTSYNGIELQDAPRDIGVYSVRLEIRDTNYRGAAVSSLTITVSRISLHNTVQIYGIKPPVIVDYQPIEAHSVVTYQKLNSAGQPEGEITMTQPTNAGVYKIIITFPAASNNGYSGEFEGELTINKAQVNLSYNGSFTYNYTGESNSLLAHHANQIRVTPNPLYTLRRSIKFYDAQSGTFTSQEPLDAGEYLMQVAIEDINYMGQAEFSYVITKSAPTIRFNPVVSPITYTDDGQEAVFEGGEVIFNGQVKTGSYRLVESVAHLQVGTHNVSYCFTPDDSRNLKEVYGVVAVSIIKKDLSEYIVFEGEHTVQYNAQSHRVRASMITGENVAIEIYYNRSKAPPRERGEYTVSAEIIDKNYSGSKEWEKKLTITIGVPMISKPKLTDINLGSPLSYSQIQGGYAYIRGTGEYVNGELVEGTATVIPGTFSFVNPSRIMNEANVREVEMSFKPFAANNFSNVVFIATVNVKGLDPVIGEVAAEANDQTAVYYGQDLSAFHIYFTSVPDGATEGVLRFADESAVLKVGQKAKYRFYPVNDKLYNIVEGEVEVTISKAIADVQSLTARAYFGKALSFTEFSAQMVNRYNPAAAVDGTFTLLSVEGFEDLNTILTMVKLRDLGLLSASTPVLRGRYRFDSPNYESFEGEADIYCYQLVDEINIHVGKTQKSYDNMPISVRDLELSASFTQHPLYDENYTIACFDANGNISEAVSVGVYTVLIEINDDMYYGSKITLFEITKADISAYIELSHYSGEYEEAIAPPQVVLSADFGDISQDSFIIEYKLVSESPLGYNQTMPTQAGVYDARVTVVNNPYFSGQRILTFTIEKKAVAVTVEGMVQTYGNVRPLNIISVEKGLTPTVTYYGASYSRSPKVPTEAGEYIARVEIIHDNYTIRSGSYRYVEVSFRILPAPLTLRESPIVSDITYGQSLSDAVITGGRVTYGEDVEVLGKYSFLDPSHKPNAGKTRATIIFTPYNKNFETLRIEDAEITVLRAKAEILFTKLTAVYDGKDKSGEIKYVSASSAQWEILFLQSGNAVTPINAGSYQIMIRILDGNHQLGVDIEGNPVLDKTDAAIFIIHKASVSEYTLPKPTPITYGQSLAYSSLNVSEQGGYGLVRYEGREGYVNGSFRYVNSGLVLGNTGAYLVDIVFEPADNINFNTFRTKVEIEVLPARATVRAENCEFEYGAPINLPTFITSPENLSVSHNIDILGQIVDCGVYKYRAWITQQNYDHEDNYIEFNITVYKKQVEVYFVDQNGQRIDKYFTTYGKLLSAKATVNPAHLVGANESLGGGNISISYYTVPKSDDIPVEYIGHDAPKDIGDYRVTAVVDHNNYYGEASIFYDIGLGEIEAVYFDQKTLEQQIYNRKIVPPIITTKPSGVSYWIDYKGYGKVLPSDVGVYNITVYFNDPNFVPKHVSAVFRINPAEVYVEGIEVEDKVYDGVDTLKITGRLKGVLPGDEVFLNLKARIAEGKIDVGIHDVEITSYSLSGFHASNYYLRKPVYNGKIQVFEMVVTDSKTQSFIKSATGFRPGVSVEFKEVDSPYNKENIFTNIMGSRAMVQSFIIKEHGMAYTLNEPVKVYIKIPDEFLNVKNLEVKGLGALSDVIIQREGNYYTFYTSTSGEVVFTSNDFSYWTIGVIAVAVVFVLGVIFLLWLNPLRRRSKTARSDAARAAVKRIKKGYY